MQQISRIFPFLCILLAAGPVYAQKSNPEILQKESELKKLRTDIQSYEKKVKESEKKEKVTLERLDDLERQSNLMRRLIKRLREEEVIITAEIDTSKTEITELETRLEFLKKHYANYVTSVYKKGRVYDLELLFSSKSINQLSIRIQYLKSFSEQRKKDLQAITESKTSLEKKNELLQSKLKDERQLLVEKTREEHNLKQTFSKRRTVLKKIRNNKKVYQKELVRKTEAFKQIENIIADLIEKERIKKEREEFERRQRELAEAREHDKRRAVLPYDALSSNHNNTFMQRKGKLRWPVTHGSIQSGFGNQVHPVLKTVTQNTGIDIATPAGSDVFAVADGEVAVLSFIPGFGNVLILNHAGGYRTVYAHLSDINVAESQHVKEGAVIAKSGDTVAGAMLHFEIWKEREKQNPEWWLIRSR
jgi:septal ring factor EnvC (AmiA/AmiB activator)